MPSRTRTSEIVTVALACAILAASTVLTGCDTTSARSDSSTPSVLARPAGEPGVGQQQFDSDDQAAASLVVAAKAHDRDAMNQLFGPSVTEFISGDKVEDEKAFDSFVTKAADNLTLEKKDGSTSVIDIGKDGWPFPIPLTRLANGKWFFDTEAGRSEILARRIGGNELQTISVCRGYVDAQREYGSVDRDGSGVFKYAQRFISKHGRDGLYWDAAPGEAASPFDPMVAQANLEGYTPETTSGTGLKPYHGYVYKILTAQGPAAPGGAYNYIINGNMIAGFALVACPTEYHNSGVYTFIISHQGKLYQKDLGAKTTDIVRSMTQYNPDNGWTPVAD
jgi:hypothetical protein